MRTRWWLVALVVVAVGCGGGDDTADDSGGDGAVLPTGFSASDLPDEFPSELVAPGLAGGSWIVLGGRGTATFETSQSYSDIVDYYTDALGEPDFSGGDADGQIATWTTGVEWAVTVLDTDPVSVGVVEVAEG